MSSLVRILPNSYLRFIQDSLLSSVNAVQCRRVCWAGHMARMG
jgi:hypothetical protein